MGKIEIFVNEMFVSERMNVTKEEWSKILIFLTDNKIPFFLNNVVVDRDEK